jgi:glycosyltransferase involved in cell wall biosynthesis
MGTITRDARSSTAGVDCAIWPRISIITPSFNQAAFLEQTIASVLDQNYPNLEYVIIDGGSTDGSVDMIRKYEPRLSYWVSEKDRGQAHAINKGIQRATGDILGYLNSDDYYLPETLKKIAESFRQRPDVDLIHGRCRTVDVNGGKLGERFGAISRYEEILDLWDFWWKQRNFVQPEVFWTKRITETIGLFREDLNWVMDYEYWARILRAGGKVGRLDAELACFRIQPNQKSTQPERTSAELLNVVRPLIWEKSNLVGWRKRTELKGKWLYQARFLVAVEKSILKGQNRLIRWAMLACLLGIHPQVLLVPQLRRRVLRIQLSLRTTSSLL